VRIKSFHINNVLSKKNNYWKYIWLFPIGILWVAAILKIAAPETMVDQFEPYGLESPELTILILGLLELGLVFTFLIPVSRLIGFLLLTAFIGGMIATELLISDGMPWFPIFLQFALWTGFYFEKREFLTPFLPGESSQIEMNSNPI
jgi:Na+-transporting NADH:ubiquinone oxidoreductase subunit NqrB